LVKLYRPLVYVIAVLIILLQGYIIWEDRLKSITYVKYSYALPNGGREVDRCFVDDNIKYVNDIINTEILIADKTKRVGVLIEGWQRVYANQQVTVTWSNRR
jgi:hypothetical protein